MSSINGLFASNGKENYHMHTTPVRDIIYEGVRSDTIIWRRIMYFVFNKSTKEIT